MKMRKEMWDSWNFVHPIPIVEYVDGDKIASVCYGGLIRILAVNFSPETRLKTIPDKLLVGGFAGRFPKGKMIWEAHLEFVRYSEQTIWMFFSAWLWNTPPVSGPANIIGFLGDYPASERAILGQMIDGKLDRARAGREDGPKNAAEVGRWWPDRLKYPS